MADENDEAAPSWRPRSPVVAVVDLSSLRDTVKLEHRLRGLPTVSLEKKKDDLIPAPLVLAPAAAPAACSPSSSPERDPPGEESCKS